MFPTKGNHPAPQLALSWATIALTVVLLSPLASANSDIESSSEPLSTMTRLLPRIGRSVNDDSSNFFMPERSVPRIGKRVNNNEIFPTVRRILTPLPRVGRSSHDGDDNFMLKGLKTSDVFKAVDPDKEPHQVVRRAGTTDQQQTLVERDFLTGVRALPRIGRRDSPATDLANSHSSEDSDSHYGADKRVPPAFTQAGSWSNGDLPWFRQQDGPLFPSKKNGLADLVRLSALPWEDAVMKEKPQDAPLTVVTLADDREVPDTWHYSIFSESDHRLE